MSAEVGANQLSHLSILITSPLIVNCRLSIVNCQLPHTHHLTVNCPTKNIDGKAAKSSHLIETANQLLHDSVIN